jgi:nitrogen regulatory protein PII
MKKIEAVISTDATEAVLQLLDTRSISNFSLYNIMAKDSFGAHIQTYRGHAYAVDLSPEVKIEAVVEDNQATATAYAILDVARGPGRTFKPRVIITPVTEVIIELRDRSLDHRRPGHDKAIEELRRDVISPPLQNTPTAQSSAWTPPSNLERIAATLGSYVRRVWTNASALRIGTSSS